ncbi:MAG: hypothetical protein SGJ27_27355 [Candidatus Melainabacteria bacterium]|nr:hypothetical protein [Candidatus Melainabacteria bacterium]
MPKKPPSAIGFGDDRKAVAYVMDSGYMWHGTEGATKWMAKILAPQMRKHIEDQVLVEDAIKGLIEECAP